MARRAGTGTRTLAAMDRRIGAAPRAFAVVMREPDGPAAIEALKTRRGREYVTIGRLRYAETAPSWAHGLMSIAPHHYVFVAVLYGCTSRQEVINDSAPTEGGSFPSSAGPTTSAVTSDATAFSDETPVPPDTTAQGDATSVSTGGQVDTTGSGTDISAGETSTTASGETMTTDASGPTTTGSDGSATTSTGPMTTESGGSTATSGGPTTTESGGSTTTDGGGPTTTAMGTAGATDSGS